MIKSKMLVESCSGEPRADCKKDQGQAQAPHVQTTGSPPASSSAIVHISLLGHCAVQFSSCLSDQYPLFASSAFSSTVILEAASARMAARDRFGAYAEPSSSPLQRAIRKFANATT